ncbi:unnamed protein product, partial [Closterium sp. NIES-53]
TSQILRTSVLLRLVRSAATARARVAGVVEEAAVVVEVAVGTVVGAAVDEVEAVVVVAAVGLVAAVEALVAAVAAAEGVAAVEAVGPVVVGLDLGAQALMVVGASTSSVGARPSRPSCSTCGKYHTERRCFARLDDAWRTEFGNDVERPHWAELLRSGVALFDLDYDVIISTMYAFSFSAEGDCYRCVPPDPGKAVATLGASASGTPPGTAPAEALHTFTFDSGASRCFFRDSTTLTPLPAPVPVKLADPSGGPVVASSSTVLPCPAVPSGSLSGLHLPSFSTKLGRVCTRWLPSLLRLFFGTTAWVTPPCHAFVACTPVSGLPRSMPPLPPSPAPPCLPCVEGRQRAAPHSSSFPPTTAPLQTLHMDVWGPARVSGQGRERYFLLVVDDYTRYTTVFPLRSRGEVSAVLIPWIRTVRLQLSERFGEDLPVLRLHSDRGGEFSSDLLWDFCCGEGITQSFTLPDSPQQNGIAERRIGLVMEVARTSMIHAATPHFLWPFAVRYTAHQLNLWPRVSLPETLPTLRWTGKVAGASVFRVWGSRAFVRDTSADKLSARAIPCIFLGFPPDAPGWQFYHPTSHRALPSQDVTFDESVLFYRLFPYHSAPPPPPPLFLAPGPPPVDPLPPQDPAPSGAAPGTASGGAASRGAEPGGAGSEGAGSGGAEPKGVEPGGAESEGAEPGGAESEGAESGGAEPRGAASSGGLAGASPRLSSQQLREWLVLRAHRRSGAPGAGEPGDTGAGGAAVNTGSGDPTEPGAAEAGGTGAGVAGVGGPGAGGAGAAGAGAVDPGAGGVGGTVRPRPYFVPLIQQVLGVQSSTGLPPSFLCPPPDQSQPPLQPASPLPVPSPYTEQSGGLTERREFASRPVSHVRTAHRAPRLRPPLVPGTHTMALRPSSVPLRVPLPAPPESSLPKVPDPGLTERLLPVPLSLVSLPLLSLTRPLNIPTPRSYSEAITGPYYSQWQAAMDAEMASWKSTGTYVDEVPPHGANIVDGKWIFRVKRLPGSPPAFKARYVARGFSQRQGVDYFQTFSPTPKMTTLRVLLHVAAQRDYELHSLDFSTAFLQGSLHEEIWLRRPPGFTGTFPVGTQWSLRRPVYGLRHAPREWHDTLRTTLAALGFAPSTADLSLFLRTDTSLPPFYVLVYVDDLVFATAHTEALNLVKSELQKRHTCTDLGELRNYLGLQITRDRARRTITLTQSHMVHPVLQRFGFQYSSPQLTPLSTSQSLSAPPSDESVEPSGPYPELVGCLMHRKVHWDAAKRVLHGVQLSSLVTQTPPGSSGEAEIYAGAMAAQELRWLTYLLTDLGEQPRSPPVLYVDNKAMIALCQEHRLEHRTKHITLRYFLAQDLQQCGQLRLA